MLLVSDGDDWTKNNPAVEFPFANSIYKLYGKESLVENAHFPNEVHDYGKNKRLAVYEFFAKHLGLDIAAVKDKNGNVTEDFVTIIERKDLEYFKPEELAGLIKGEQVYNVLLRSQR